MIPLKFYTVVKEYTELKDLSPRLGLTRVRRYTGEEKGGLDPLGGNGVSHDTPFLFTYLILDGTE